MKQQQWCDAAADEPHKVPWSECRFGSGTATLYQKTKMQSTVSKVLISTVTLLLLPSEYLVFGAISGKLVLINDRVTQNQHNSQERANDVIEAENMDSSPWRGAFHTLHFRGWRRSFPKAIIYRIKLPTVLLWLRRSVVSDQAQNTATACR